MTSLGRSGLILTSMLSAVVLTGCVSRSDYDALQAQNQQLQQQVEAQSAEIAANKEQINRLQGAIKYTVNSDLLFAPGTWKMSAQGRPIIARMAEKLAPTQQNKLLVAGYTDNTPIGPVLQQQGITSNKDLSEKRADSVMQFLIAQGVKPELVSAQGFGEDNPIAPNDTAAGRAKSRRVELSLVAS